MKYLFIVALLVLSGCADQRPLDQREYSKATLTKIPELADCLYIKIDDVRIFRCPNSSTTTAYTVPSGKSRKTVTTTVVEEEK
jgi:hypothetical protein